MDYVIGIDLGTSSLKAVLVSREGKLIDTRSASYELAHPQSGYSEQNPEDWVQAFYQVWESLVETYPTLKEDLVGLSFSGQMHSLVLLDDKGEVIRAAILWNDTRTSEECKRITDTFGKELLTITKNIALEGFTLPKILWVQSHEPENWERVAKVLLPKDYLRYRLTGTFNMDYSDASGTLLMDFVQKKWSKEICHAFKIAPSMLPDLVSSLDEVGGLSEEVMAKMGLTRNIKVYAGGADNACAAFGAGIIDSKKAMVSIGTSGVFLKIEDKPIDCKGKLHQFYHVLPDVTYLMGVTLSAGYSLKWFKDTFASHMLFDELVADAARIPAGAEGLLFAPYLVGERSPHMDPKVRGGFVGIDARHTLSHFARAVLEGITYSLKDCQVLLEKETQNHCSEIVAVGGGAKNPVWMQLQADVFDANFRSLKVEEGPGFGAAMIALYGLDEGKDIQNFVSELVAYGEEVKACGGEVEVCARGYEEYKKVYPALNSIL